MEHRAGALVMGIVNVTPDSFYDGGVDDAPSETIERALRMIEDGADLLDIGGESTRPGAPTVSEEAELERVIPIIEGIRKHTDAVLSIDTTKAVVARAALDAGATVVNDVSALRGDPEMAPTLAEHGAWTILMHMQGTPQTMQQNPAYTDVVSEVASFLEARIHYAMTHGIPEQKILIDPGIGFGKRLEHNVDLIARLGELDRLGRPIVIGISRKSMLGALLGLPVESRLEATIAANAVAVAHGADMIRVHDVKEGRRTADLARRLRRHEA